MAQNHIQNARQSENDTSSTKNSEKLQRKHSDKHLTKKEHKNSKELSLSFEKHQQHLQHQNQIQNQNELNSQNNTKTPPKHSTSKTSKQTPSTQISSTSETDKKNKQHLKNLQQFHKLERLPSQEVLLSEGKAPHQIQLASLQNSLNHSPVKHDKGRKAYSRVHSRKNSKDPEDLIENDQMKLPNMNIHQNQFNHHNIANQINMQGISDPQNEEYPKDLGENKYFGKRRKKHSKSYNALPPPFLVQKHHRNQFNPSSQQSDRNPNTSNKSTKSTHPMYVNYS